MSPRQERHVTCAIDTFWYYFECRALRRVAAVILWNVAYHYLSTPHYKSDEARTDYILDRIRFRVTKSTTVRLVDITLPRAPCHIRTRVSPGHEPLDAAPEVTLL